ncbi:MAG: RHS repeat-associated core domain-containing protein [Candidatus Hydrogenedentes bacterium]|nr:RHS repeat-associated core domain-containing protein [Candidatus Hydrogenedentota bacterium]
MAGTTDAMVKVLETTSSAVTTAGRRCAVAGYFTFASGTGNYLDDVVVLKLDGDTVETETQAIRLRRTANEMTSHTLDGATTSFAYDQFGRMTQKTRTGGYTGTYYYNYGDKLTKVASNFQGEGTVTYAYPPAADDQKRRSRAVTGGAMTKYRVDQGWGVVNEENSGGTLLSTYIHHPGRQIGTVLATSEGSTASSGTYAYYFQDAIGSTRSLWDEDGDRLGKYDYTPFGGKYGNTGEEITRKFTGHDWDNEARLYHTAYRQYSPDSGRWLTRDPLGMHDGPNVYAYVVNNPVSLWDADGRFFGGISGVAVGGAIGGELRGRNSSYSMAKFVQYMYFGILLGCALEAMVGGYLGPQGPSIRHCVVACRMKRCAGMLIGSGDFFFTVGNDTWELLQSITGLPFGRGWTFGNNDSREDTEAAVFGATMCGRDCDSCEDCCGAFYRHR